MQRLHVLGVSDDGDALLLAARRGAKTARFSIRLDEDLVEALEESGIEVEWDAEELRPSSEVDREPISAIGIREVQDRLRAGWSEEEIAEQAGTTPEWVSRFAPPIRAEQRQVIERARSLVFSKKRAGPSSRPLGESVAWNVAEKGVVLTYREFEDAWSAYLAGDRWIIRFDYVSRGRAQSAEWELEGSAVVNRNSLGATLGYVEPGRRRPRDAAPDEEEVAPKPPAPKRSPKKRRSAKKKRAPKRKRPAKKKAAPKKRKAAPKRKRPAKKKAAPKKRKAAPRKKRPAKKKAAPKKRKAAPRKKRPAKKKAAPAKKRAAERKPRARRAPGPRRERPLRASRLRAVDDEPLTIAAPDHFGEAGPNGWSPPARRPVFREGTVEVAGEPSGSGAAGR